MTDLGSWAAAAEEIAITAGRVLTGHAERFGELRTEFKGRRELVTVADREAERVVVEGLQARFPDHAILAEEGVLTPKGKPSLESEWLWLVDPLDGTTNFVHGLPFYCVSLALARAGQPVIGVVHAPALGSTWTGWQGGGAFRDGRPLQVTGTADLGNALLATGFSYDRNEPGHPG